MDASIYSPGSVRGGGVVCGVAGDGLDGDSRETWLAQRVRAKREGSTGQRGCFAGAEEKNMRRAAALGTTGRRTASGLVVGMRVACARNAGNSSGAWSYRAQGSGGRRAGKNRAAGAGAARTWAVGLAAALLTMLGAGMAGAQTIGVTYVCNGEKIFIENCNIRDTSDTSKCMVGHPETVLANGLMKYTYETRGDLKKLLPTCKQPSAEEMAKAQAFQKKQQDLYNANEKKAMEQLKAIESAPPPGQAPQKPKTPEERALARCITAGRLPASCTGNTLMGAFSQMVTAVLPEAGAKEAAAGSVMAGVFEGAGKWRLDFIDGGVLVNCSFLSPNQQSYTLDFRNGRTAIVIDTTPKPLVLTLNRDGTVTGPGPVVIDGVVASGYAKGDASTSYSGYRDQNGMSISDAQATSGGGPVYDRSGNRVYSPTAAGTQGHTVFAKKTATCPAVNLSTKGASVGVQTMQTDLLKTMFGGDKGPPTPPGIRMKGIYAAMGTGFSVQFFPESAVLGCGPDAARAYPYSVVADGGKAVVEIAAPDHPLKLTLAGDGSLEPGSAEAYQVHGRVVTGQGENDEFTFAPMEQTCNLGRLTASKTIPASGGTAGTAVAAGGGAGAGAAGAAGGGVAAVAGSAGGGRLSSVNAPTGNAVLTIVSGFPAQAGVMNPLAGHPYVLLRDDYDGAIRKAGIAIPAGMTGQKYVGSVCAARTPECQKALAAVSADAATAMRADANGKAALPGVPPGKYYLMISAQYNKQVLTWGFAVELKAGANTVTLDPNNAVVMK